MTEAALKRSVISALHLALRGRGKVLRHNAGLTVIGEGATRRVITGVEAGTPDLQVLLPGGRSVWLELKTAKGRLSRAQLSWHAEVSALGHTVVVVRDVSSALRACGLRGAA